MTVVTAPKVYNYFQKLKVWQGFPLYLPESTNIIASNYREIHQAGVHVSFQFQRSLCVKRMQNRNTGFKCSIIR